MYSTILFDFDGTLASSLDAWLVAFEKTFVSFGQSVSHESIIERCSHRSFEEIVLEFGLSGALQFEEMVLLELGKAYEQVKLFAGVEEVLQDCQNKKIKLAVVTSAPGKQVESALHALGIDSFFGSIVTADHVTNFKPHPEPVSLALKNIDSDASDTLFVGDSIVDILAGQAAGTKTALFFPEMHKRFYDYQKLMETKPDFVFNHYEELGNYLEEHHWSYEKNLPIGF
jgi:HAD superfamily hydrolase (TIGR01549 family)